MDYAADGCIAGVEILDARQRIGDRHVFRQVLLLDIALERPGV